MQKIAIFTANGKTLEPMLGLIKERAGVDLHKDRYVIVGCEAVPGFEAVANGDPVIYEDVEPGMIDLTRKVLEGDSAITAILLECTELPQFADALRKEFRLPVSTAVTCTDHFMSGLLDNPCFGLNDWLEDADDLDVGRKKRRGRKHKGHNKRNQKLVEGIVQGLETLFGI